MDEDQWMYDNIMSKEVNMNEENREEPGVNEENREEPGVLHHIDCFDAFNTSQVLIWFCFLLK